MLNKYFLDLEKSLLKKKKAKKTSTKKKTDNKPDIENLKDEISNVIPADLAVDFARPINAGGYAPEGADLIIYYNYCKAIKEIMGGYIPRELLFSTLHAVEKLDKMSLAETLNRVIGLKKLSTMDENDDDEVTEIVPVPAFAIVYNSDYSILDLKTDVMNYYLARNIDHLYEVDIIVILNQGLLVKDWRQRRNYIGLETEADTMMWFFVLMSEYLDIERPKSMDFRHYVKRDVVYKEY